ncbi:MAG: Zn-dependent dipeptidase [Sphingomonas bacterium]|nr:Zn-dependent dipeptidase [Sphingomonas bacterium]
MNRRRMLKLAGGAIASTLLVGRGRARDTNIQAGRDTAIIDGNLVAPIDGTTPLDAATTAQVRSSGLTAFKMTLGGSGNRNKAQTDAEIADLIQGIAINPDLFMMVRTPDDFDRARRSGRTGVILSFEAGEMLEGRVENIDHFRSAGVLVMGLSYNVITPFASGVLAPRSTGLTDLGRQAVRRMNTLGVTVDVSHSDEPSSMGALAASQKPLLITHAGCAAVHPHPRNKSDALLRALADKGGVVGIYELSYLTAPPAQPTLDDYLAHLVQALNVCGEDHVGIGTDGLLTPFDTSPESMKAWYAEIARRKATGVGAPGEGPPPFVIGLNRPDRYAVIGDALRRRGHPSRTSTRFSD